MAEIEYIEIDPVSRKILSPAGMLLGVMEDADSERKYFKCPKIVGDDIDLSQSQIYFKYTQATDKDGTKFETKEPGIYHCDDVNDEGDYITFSWKLSGNVFLEKGFIAFSMFASDGDVVRWGTTTAVGTVLLTIPGGLEEVAERYPDVISQLIQRMDDLTGISPEDIATAVEEYLAENPPSGMTDAEREQLQKNTDDISSLSETVNDLKENGAGGGSGLTSSVKNALLNAFSHVAWSDENGQSYYDALATALNSSGSDSGESGDEGSGEDEGGTTVVTLTSISATYGGGEVASGTALSDLTGIVVTGNYSDGTTKTITNYELSGEISSGTNTITVSYGGLTTTFEVVGTTSTRTYLELNVGVNNTATTIPIVSSDDGETTTTVNTGIGFIINQTFDKDVDVHFKITWGGTTIYRNLYLASAYYEEYDITATSYTNNSLDALYRVKSCKDYYVEGSGDTYAYAGNVYEGTYTLKAGCVLMLGNMNAMTAVQWDVDNTYFYVEE